MNPWKVAAVLAFINPGNLCCTIQVSFRMSLASDFCGAPEQKTFYAIKGTGAYTTGSRGIVHSPGLYCGSS